MSIGRLFHEFRPMFRMLEEPMMRPAAFYGARSPRLRYNKDDSSFNWPTLQPAVDLKDSGKAYIVEADLPGVNKGDIDVQVGDMGQSLTIRGSVTRRSPPAEEKEEISKTQDADSERGVNTLSAERSYVENTEFTRTVWFPQAVDARKIKAQLKDGVLTVNAAKQEGESETQRISIE